jgi:prepilin-type N-terminal cleavage/methylation domain-containing protein
MRRARGFTLIELVVVVAVVGILAGLAAVGFRSATRNASLAKAAYGVAVRLGGLRAQALSTGRDHLFVFVDAPDGDASGCSWRDSDPCARWIILSAPADGWTLTGFDPDAPAGSGGTEARIEETELMPRGVHLDTDTPEASLPPVPEPFSAVVARDADLQTTLSTRLVFAIRFRANGTVAAEAAAGGTPAKAGYAFVLGTDVGGTTGADRRALLVSFPTGIVKTYSNF